VQPATSVTNRYQILAFSRLKQQQREERLKQQQRDRILPQMSASPCRSDPATDVDADVQRAAAAAQAAAAAAHAQAQAATERREKQRAAAEARMRANAEPLIPPKIESGATDKSSPLTPAVAASVNRTMAMTAIRTAPMKKPAATELEPAATDQHPIQLEPAPQLPVPPDPSALPALVPLSAPPNAAARDAAAPVSAPVAAPVSPPVAAPVAAPRGNPWGPRRRFCHHHHLEDAEPTPEPTPEPGLEDADRLPPKVEPPPAPAGMDAPSQVMSRGDKAKLRAQFHRDLEHASERVGRKDPDDKCDPETAMLIKSDPQGLGKWFASFMTNGQNWGAVASSHY